MVLIGHPLSARTLSFPEHAQNPLGDLPRIGRCSHEYRCAIVLICLLTRRTQTQTELLIPFC